MRYNDIIKLINLETREFQKRIALKPEVILEYNKFRYKGLCLKLARSINNKLLDPWVSLEELNSIYTCEITESKTNRGNKYYQIGDDTRIYSSVVHGTCFFDNDQNMYVPIILQHIGDISKYYNTEFLVKINMTQSMVLLKLMNHECSFNINEKFLKTDEEIKEIITNQILIDANTSYIEESIDDNEYYEL